MRTPVCPPGQGEFFVAEPRLAQGVPVFEKDAVAVEELLPKVFRPRGVDNALVSVDRASSASKRHAHQLNHHLLEAGGFAQYVAIVDYLLLMSEKIDRGMRVTICLVRLVIDPPFLTRPGGFVGEAMRRQRRLPAGPRQRGGTRFAPPGPGLTRSLSRHRYRRRRCRCTGNHCLHRESASCRRRRHR